MSFLFIFHLSVVDKHYLSVFHYIDSVCVCVKGEEEERGRVCEKVHNLAIGVFHSKGKNAFTSSHVGE